MTLSNAYIAACEIQSPNSPDFDHVHEHQREKHMTRATSLLLCVVECLHKSGDIDDEQFIEFTEALRPLLPNAS